MNAILNKIVFNQNLEARWLNTLSLLEHIGARKIGKTVFQTHPSLAILEHHADEARHAFIFKKMAVDLGAGADDYLCAKEGVSYFQKLDHQASAWIAEHVKQSGQYENYVMTTCLIERRAMKLYPLYKAATKRIEIAEELAEIIAEETSHRHVIEDEAKKILSRCGESLTSLLEMEASLFKDFEKVLVASIAG